MGSCWMANCMSGLQGAMKMKFYDGCAKVGVNHDHPEELLTRAPSLSSVLPRLAVGFEFSNP